MLISRLGCFLPALVPFLLANGLRLSPSPIHKVTKPAPFFRHQGLLTAYSPRVLGNFKSRFSIFSKNAPTAIVAAEGSDANAVAAETPKKKSGSLQTRIITSLVLAVLVTYWILGGKSVFTMGFLLQSIFAQREYFRMCEKAGVVPARRISFVSTMFMYVIACILPKYHELVMPLGGLAVMSWLLLMRKAPAKISEVSTTIHGMFYIGYIPSYWIRLSILDNLLPIRPHITFLAERWPSFLSFFPSPLKWTQGSIIIWWTFLTIVCADVGAFAAGKLFGRTKLSRVRVNF